MSRTTIYQKVSYGKLARTADKKTDITEMLRVLGESVSNKRTEQPLNTINSTHPNSQTVRTEL